MQEKKEKNKHINKGKPKINNMDQNLEKNQEQRNGKKPFTAPIYISSQKWTKIWMEQGLRLSCLQVWRVGTMV